MQPPFPYVYYNLLSENHKLISEYVKYIEALRILTIDKKLDNEVELIIQNRLSIKQNYNINDHTQYRRTEDTAKYHPLALQYYEVQEQLKPFYERQIFELTTDIVSLAIKGKILSTLMNARVDGFDEKLSNLVSKDINQYEKTFYEIEVASQFVLQGNDVKFIKASAKKSADLLIDDSVEIECKSKDLVHPYYRKYEDLWKIMTGIVPEWMHRNRLNYMIYIVLEKEIDTESIKLIKNRIHEIISKKREGTFSIVKKKISIQAKLLLPYDLDIDKPLTVENFPEIMKAIPSIKDSDFLTPLFTLYPTKEKIIQRNYRYLAMKIPQHPMRSIISNVKRAASQVNRTLPSLIYIDISSLNKKMKIFDLNKLSNEVENFLRNNPAINAVVITDTYATGVQGKIVIKKGIWIIRNTHAKHTLPNTFSIPLEANSSKESLIADNYWV